MNKDSKRQALVDALRDRTPEMKDELSHLQKWSKAELKRPDFVWHMLLQSFATLGGSNGYRGLIENQDNYERVNFERLSKLYPKKRHETLQKVFREAGIRYANRKAELMARNYDLVEEMGGLEEARAKAMASKGKEAKIAFMKRFANIGPKYARNIWMGVYDSDFRDTIAVDSRIKKVTKALGRSFKTYEEEERFYQDIAKEAGLQGWQVDRLLYNYTDHFLTAISASEGRQRRGRR